jgi:hypothetical protein
MDKVAPRLIITGLLAIVMGALVGWPRSPGGDHTLLQGGFLAAVGCCFVVSGIVRYWRPPHRED